MNYKLGLLAALAIITTGTLFFVQSCTKDAIYTDVCFQENVMPIFVSNCTTSGCHNPTDRKEGYDFTTYEGIMKGIKPKHLLESEIWEAINETGDDRMPPAGPLSEKDMNTIKAWILMGAPNNSGCGGNCDTTVFTYSGGVDPIIQTYCRGCHNNGNQSGAVNLESYTDVYNQAMSNYLLGVVKHESGYIPMPYNSQQLSDCQIRVIEKWINAGAPNN
ncbi:MAG: hypothetical protein Fur0041_10350 [Bacteroidia bacterium]